MNSSEFKRVNSYMTNSKYASTPQYTHDEEEEFANIDELDDVDELASGNI